MMAQIHQIKPDHPRRRSRQIGRGGKRGTTAGRGTKGQRARAGHRIRPEIRDVIKRLPKKRGHRFHRPPQSAATIVTLRQIASLFPGVAKVTPAALLKLGLISKVKGRLPRVKILAGGELRQPVKVSGCRVSVGAREKILAGGGEVLDTKQ